LEPARQDDRAAKQWAAVQQMDCPLDLTAGHASLARFDLSAWSKTSTQLCRARRRQNILWERSDHWTLIPTVISFLSPRLLRINGPCRFVATNDTLSRLSLTMKSEHPLL